MRRVISLTVGKNEADRYLRPVLGHLTQVVDTAVFYDDQSTDSTPSIARDCGCVGLVRDDSFASFSDDEGAFRADSWKTLMATARPEEGDWVLINDCDEVLIGDMESDPALVRLALLATVDLAEVQGCVAVDLHIPEVFGHQDGTPLVRTDGEWGNIHGPRLFAYRPGATFPQGRMGAPSAPLYVMGAPQHYHHTNRLSLMHYGYADPADWRMKFERYAGVPGHANAHVQSILGEKMVTPWGGPHIGGMNKGAASNT